MYDSMGEFSTQIVRDRLKIHSSVNYHLEYKSEPRDECFDQDDYGVLFEFFVRELRKALLKLEPTDNDDMKYQLSLKT